MNYTKYAEKSFSKIKQYGAPIKIIRSGEKNYNSATNTYEDNGKEISGYALQSSFTQKNIDGTNIRFGDVLFFAVFDETPKSNDEIIFNEKSYTIINVDKCSPDGRTDIFYSLQAR